MTESEVGDGLGSVIGLILEGVLFERLWTSKGGKDPKLMNIDAPFVTWGPSKPGRKGSSMGSDGNINLSPSPRQISKFGLRRYSGSSFSKDKSSKFGNWWTIMLRINWTRMENLGRSGEPNTGLGEGLKDLHGWEFILAEMGKTSQLANGGLLFLP